MHIFHTYIVSIALLYMYSYLIYISEVTDYYSEHVTFPKTTKIWHYTCSSFT